MYLYLASTINFVLVLVFVLTTLFRKVIILVLKVFLTVLSTALTDTTKIYMKDA